eukprot:COSAG02_NODE_259_length_26776_cov_1723.750084_16_plen_94_part_00
MSRAVPSSQRRKLALLTCTDGVCAGQWELRKGVLAIGGFFTVLILAMAVVYLFIPAIAAIWSVFLLVLGLVWGQGVWAVYKRELKNSASRLPP